MCFDQTLFTLIFPQSSFHAERICSDASRHRSVGRFQRQLLFTGQHVRGEFMRPIGRVNIFLVTKFVEFLEDIRHAVFSRWQRLCSKNDLFALLSTFLAYFEVTVRICCQLQKAVNTNLDCYLPLVVGSMFK